MALRLVGRMAMMEMVRMMLQWSNERDWNKTDE